MNKGVPEKRRLSIYLIKEEYTDFSSIVKDGIPDYDIELGPRLAGRLYIKETFPSIPSWYSMFQNNIVGDPGDSLRNRNAAAVFLFPHAGRVFALAFGYGRSLLQPNTWEERFGLRVVLNSIDPDMISIVERKNLDTMMTQTRTQSSKKCGIEEFGLDVQQILLKAVSGIPADTGVATSLTGADSLNIYCQVTLGTLGDKCDSLLAASESDRYRESFGWVDNLRQVKEKPLIEDLDDEAVTRLKTYPIPQRTYLAIPDIIDPPSVDGFRFPFKHSQKYEDIHVQDFLSLIRNADIITPEYLKGHHITVVHADTGFEERRWSIYNCLNCEIDRDGKTYVLTEGTWYEIDSSFVESTESSISAIAKIDLAFPSKRNQKECEYCGALQQADESHYALMDRKIIRYGGGRSSLEFCDLYTSQKDIIHVKRYSGSSVLSHLFAQGVNSATVFVRDSDFRNEVNKLLPDAHKLDDPLARPDVKKYRVVFAIISEKAEGVPMNLPFFSKISLARASDYLEQVLGYRVAVAGISIHPPWDRRLSYECTEEQE